MSIVAHQLERKWSDDPEKVGHLQIRKRTRSATTADSGTAQPAQPVMRPTCTAGLIYDFGAMRTRILNFGYNSEINYL